MVRAMTPRLLRPLQREWQGRQARAGVGDRRSIVRTLRSLDRAASRGEDAQSIRASILGRPFHAADGKALRRLFGEIYIDGEYAVELATRAPTIVDGGANVGLATLFFKLRYPEATVHAVEANPATFRFLEENVRGNSLSNVHLYSQALSCEEGELELFVGGDAGGMRSSVRPERGGAVSVRVPGRRLSALLRTLPSVDLVKLDVEGAEPDVLADMIETSTLTVPRRFLIEYHHQIAGDPPRLAAFLQPFEDAGFRYHLTARGERLGRFQDILIHAAQGAGRE